MMMSLDPLQEGWSIINISPVGRINECVIWFTLGRVKEDQKEVQDLFSRLKAAGYETMDEDVNEDSEEELNFEGVSCGCLQFGTSDSAKYAHLKDKESLPDDDDDF